MHIAKIRNYMELITKAALDLSIAALILSGAVYVFKLALA